jgi:ketosteroid isomerase-like protein
MVESGAQSAEAWIKRYYALLGEKDIDGAMQYWAPDGELRFANAEPVVGREEIRAKFRELVDSFAKETHTVLDLWELPDDVVIFELGVDFVRLDGGEASVRGATICRVEGERFLEQRTYVDLAPVFAASPATSETPS